MREKERERESGKTEREYREISNERDENIDSASRHMTHKDVWEDKESHSIIRKENRNRKK